LPVEQIEGKIRPTDAQVAMLDDLKAASAQAQAGNIGRLDAVAKRVQAVIQAVQILRWRCPLTTLCSSLDIEQKDRFAAIGTQSKHRRARITREEPLASNLCKQQTGNFARRSAYAPW
jgi:hypothetical protein